MPSLRSWNRSTRANRTSTRDGDNAHSSLTHLDLRTAVILAPLTDDIGASSTPRDENRKDMMSGLSRVVIYRELNALRQPLTAHVSVGYSGRWCWREAEDWGMAKARDRCGLVRNSR